MPDITRTTTIAAPAEKVWSLVSDLPGMGALSPENTGGKWLKGAAGPAVGARFKGTNRNGVRRWSTTVEVTRCVPGQEFAFDVSYLGIPVAEWSYVVRSEGEGCQVTEGWTDRRPGWFAKVGTLATGVPDRDGDATVRSIDATLAAVKAAAEN